MNATAQAARPEADTRLADRTVAFLIPVDGAGQAETLQAWDAVTSAGGRAALVCPESGEAYLTDGHGHGVAVPIDRRLADAHASDFDALVLPGGPAGPDTLGRDPDVTRFLTAFFLAGKPIAANSQAAHPLLEAGLVDDRMLTAPPELSAEVVAKGGTWHDYPVVVCHNGPNVLLTGRGPQDLGAFCAAMVDEFAASLGQHGPRHGARPGTAGAAKP